MTETNSSAKRETRGPAVWLVPLVLLCLVGAAIWFFGFRREETGTPRDVQSEPKIATAADIRRWRRDAEAFRQAGDQAKVAGVYRDALQFRLLSDEELNFRHRLLEALILLGDAKAAREELAALRRRNLSSTDEVRVLVHEARLSRLEGHPQRAIEFLNRVLPRLGFPPQALCERGILHLDLGQLQDAVRDLQRVVQAVPEHEIAHFKLAEAYRRLKQPRESKRHFDIYSRIHRRNLKQSDR